MYGTATFALYLRYHYQPPPPLPPEDPLPLPVRGFGQLQLMCPISPQL